MKYVTMLVLLAAGCASPVVGAECGDGYAQCGSACVDLSSDPLHCGACDNACPAESYCSSGVCVGEGPSDGGTDRGDATVYWLDHDPMPRIDGPGVGRDRPRPTEPGPGCDLGELSCDASGCIRPDTDVRHCGGCDIACAEGALCAGGSCVAACEEPFELCDGVCIDTRIDADHCGGCRTVCSTGLCVDSECRSPLAGHVVIIGHDYVVRRAAMGRIVGNAVMLARGRSVAVVTYEGMSTPASRGGTDASIDAGVAETGRGWTRISTTADEIPYRLASAGVLLVYAQPDLSTDDGVRLGQRWAQALESFLAIGGTVVFLVGGQGAEGGTLPILEGADLLAPRPTRVDISGAVVDVIRPWDALAVGVPLSYRAERTTVRLEMSLADAVVADAMGPVVIHRTVVP